MAKLVSCYECGYDYTPKTHSSCPRCGEVKIFDPRLHDENYDSSKDAFRNGKFLVLLTIAIFAFYSFAIIMG
jgi:predicted RNA-binding Zn-ribbon protein involved in translation (DUF1610 family)